MVAGCVYSMCISRSSSCRRDSCLLLLGGYRLTCGSVLQGAAGAGHWVAMPYSFDTTVREWSYTMQELNQQDLDRNFSLATTHIVKWCVLCRVTSGDR